MMPQSLSNVLVHVVFSVSQSQSDEVERYIARQPDHHRKLDFQQEFRNLLDRHAIGWDERYVWD